MALNATDWAYPTTVTGTGWTNVSGSLATDVKLDDNTNMAFHANPVRATNPLICSVWETAPATALAIPPGATPVGLEVALQGYGNGASLPGTPLQIGVAFSKDAVTMIGDTKTIDVLEYTIGNPQPVQYLGSSSELWGAGWTDVEAEGNALFLFYQQGATTGRYVDYVAMRIWYTDGSVIGPSTMGGSTSRCFPGLNCSHKLDPQSGRQ